MASNEPLSGSPEYIRMYWEKVRGWYLLVRKDTRGDLLAKTRSPQTAANLVRHGFKGVGSAYYLYSGKLENFATYESNMQENPRRPPKQWMRDCVAGASKSARDPGAVCGALWYRKMSPAQRRAALRREGKAEAALALANPAAGATVAWVVGAIAVGGGLLWLLTRPKPAAAETAATAPAAPAASPASSTTVPTTPAVVPVSYVDCAVTPADAPGILDWAAKHSLVGFYYSALAPPELSWAKTVLNVKNASSLVIVTSDGRFWRYEGANAVEAPELKASYCSERPTGIKFPSHYAHGVDPSAMFMV